MTQAGNTYGYGYSDRNRMTVAQLGGSTIANYTYNAHNQRVAKNVGGNIERYDYESAQIIGEYGTTNRDYVWLGQIPVAVIDNTMSGSLTTSTVNYVTADQLGTPRVVTNGAGTVIWQWAYAGNSWGEVPPTSSNGYTLNLRFPGQYADAETGLFFNNNRYFCNGCGRYTQSDPFGVAAGVSTFEYSGSNPLNAFDELALSCAAAGGTVTCTAPTGGPTVSFPQPEGWPATMDDSSAFYHAYDVPVSDGGADPSAVMQQVANNPTPGSPSPATPQGTYNNATPSAIQNLYDAVDKVSSFGTDPGGYNNSPVMSYLTTDKVTGNPVVVNVTLPGHPLFPGYVAREVCDGVVHNFGEGTNWKQSKYAKGLAGLINGVWVPQTQSLLSNLH